MKRTTNSLRFVSSMVVVALLGLVVGGAAWGQDRQGPWDDLFGSYKIAKGNSQGNVHENAIYIVYETQNSPLLAGIFFMERHKNSDYKNQPFICDDAVWSDTNKSNSYGCSRFLKKGGEVRKEKLTIGTIDGTFCSDLRTSVNTGNEKIILEETACQQLKCSCYEVKQLCKNGDVWDECKKDFPPGGGAGSGKDN